MDKGLLAALLLTPAFALAQAQFNAAYGDYGSKVAGSMATFAFKSTFNGPDAYDISPARQACIYLNNGFHSANTKWEHRTCHLVRTLQRPDTLIDAGGDRSATHIYRPTQIGKEAFRFVLSFGGEEIEVTCILETEAYQH